MKNMQLLLAVPAGLGLVSCQETPTSAAQPTTNPTESLSDDTDNLPPEGVGEPIKSDALKGSPAPNVEIDDRVTGNNRKDLQVLVDSAVALIVKPELARTGAQVAAANPRVYLRENLEEQNSEQTAMAVASPPAGWSYLSTRLNLTGGGAVTGPNRRNTPHALRILIPAARLRMWRSKNLVERSCALNTTAHEISHTLVSSSTRFFPVFTDTGASSNVRRTYASYLTGDMAQCTFLRMMNRIDGKGVTGCVPAWTGWNAKKKHVYFRSGICSRFNSTEPVRWPKG